MGAKKKHRKQFFAANPTCCFCGGTRAVETIDHQPPRVAFYGRHWPEGYEFPACKNCNAATRADEQIFGWLARSNDLKKEHDPAHHAEWRNNLDAIRNNFPGLLESLRLSGREVRNFLKERKIERTAGSALHDVPVLKINHPTIQQAVENCSGKLICALFYKHTGAVLPHTGYVAFRWMTNVQVGIDRILDGADLSAFRYAPLLKRAKTNLADQFSYRFVRAKDGPLHAFLCQFRSSFYVLGHAQIKASGKLFDHSLGSPNVKVWHPYKWDEV
jgi:hypothetical protein